MVAADELIRAQIYRLLARFLAAPPDQTLLQATASLVGDGSEFGQAIGLLADAADAASPQPAGEEFHDLFIGVTRGELLPYGSYYLTGFLHEKPLASLRGDLARLGIARADHVKEPEDHIAALCEVMAGLIDGSFGPAMDLAAQRAFFEAHLAPWAAKFFDDLRNARAARLYAALAVVGRKFIDIETAAFAMES